MYQWIHWELVTDPKGSTQHTLGTTALYEKVNIKKIYRSITLFFILYLSETRSMNQQ